MTHLLGHIGNDSISIHDKIVGTLGTTRKASEASNTRPTLKEELAGLGNKDCGSAVFASVCFQIFFLFFAGNHIVPIRLSIPHWHFVNVARTVPFVQKGQQNPKVVISDQRTPSKCRQPGHTQIKLWIVKRFDASGESTRQGRSEPR